MEKLLTLKDVQEILAQRWPDDPPALSTLQLWAAKGLFKGAVIMGRVYVIPESALDDFERPKRGRPRKEADQ